MSASTGVCSHVDLATWRSGVNFGCFPEAIYNVLVLFVVVVFVLFHLVFVVLFFETGFLLPGCHWLNCTSRPVQSKDPADSASPVLA